MSNLSEGPPLRAAGETILSQGDSSLSLDQLLTMIERSPADSTCRARTGKLVERLLNLGRAVGPCATPPRAGNPFLTIGMATYDDYDGVYFSIMAIRMFHPEILDSVEFLVVDNHPEGLCSEALKSLERPISNYRYLPVRFIKGTAIRDVVMHAARGEFVLCMDSHVMFAAGSLSRLLEHLRRNPDTRDLFQGPLAGYNRKIMSTHWQDSWGGGMWGQWGLDPRGKDPDEPPFEISMMGLGAFCCRRAIWPGFNQRLRGFGGEEGYIHEKFRRNGGRVVCLPFLVWLHRFERPMGIAYPLQWVDRVRNYLIAFQELGLSKEPIFENLSPICGLEECQAVERRLQEELSSPFYPFAGLFCLYTELNEQEVGAGLREEGLGARFSLSRFNGPARHRDLCVALELRDLCQESRWRNLESILIVEMRTAGSADDWAELGKSLPEPPSPGTFWRLNRPGEAFNLVMSLSAEICAEIADTIPVTHVEAAIWLRREDGLESYLDRLDPAPPQTAR